MTTTTDPRSARVLPAPSPSAPAGPDSLADQVPFGNHPPHVGEGSYSPQARPDSTPIALAPAVTALPGGQRGRDAHPQPAAGEPGPGRPAATDKAVSIPAALLADPLLALAADVLDDLEKVRVANENRLRQLTRTEADADGQERGFGLDESHPDVARLAALVALLGEAEHKAELNLARLMRRHPLGPWVGAQKGIGDKQAARLLAAISDPYFNDLHDRPRTVSELWAFCGFHVIRTSASGQSISGTHQPAAAGGIDGHPGQSKHENQRGPAGVAPRRQRGQRSNWSETARKRAWLVAVSCMKSPGGHYRAVYDATRAKYAEAVHAVPCIRCGPAGKPAPEGSALSDGHKHARALRAVAKEVLRDLWRESRRLHQEGEEMHQEGEAA